MLFNSCFIFPCCIIVGHIIFFSGFVYKFIIMEKTVEKTNWETKINKKYLHITLEANNFFSNIANYMS